MDPARLDPSPPTPTQTPRSSPGKPEVSPTIDPDLVTRHALTDIASQLPFKPHQPFKLTKLHLLIIVLIFLTLTLTVAASIFLNCLTTTSCPSPLKPYATSLLPPSRSSESVISKPVAELPPTTPQPASPSSEPNIATSAAYPNHSAPAQARDLQRQADLRTLQQALTLAQSEPLFPALPSIPTCLGTASTCLDLAPLLVPDYLTAIPTDPTAGSSTNSQYTIFKTQGRTTLTASGEAEPIFSLTF